MSDLALFWEADQGAADLQIAANNIVTTDDLENAVLLSLFLNRAAEPTDVLPPGITDRQGWWADATADMAGDKIGSRLWLLQRSKRTPDVLPRGREYAREALQWMLDDGVTTQMDFATSFVGSAGWSLLVAVTRPNGTKVSFRYNFAWDAQALRSAA